MHSTIFLDIISFIEKSRYKYKIDYNMNTKLELDLKICGHDAIDLFIDYSKNFNVDITDFNFQKYFSPEYFTFSNNFETKLPEIDLSDLVIGVMNGYLNDDLVKINHENK